MGLKKIDIFLVIFIRSKSIFEQNTSVLSKVWCSKTGIPIYLERVLSQYICAAYWHVILNKGNNIPGFWRELINLMSNKQ